MAKSSVAIYVNKKDDDHLIRIFGGNEREVKLLTLSYLSLTKNEFLNLHPYFLSEVQSEFNILVDYAKKLNSGKQEKSFTTKSVTAEQKLWLMGQTQFNNLVDTIKNRTLGCNDPFKKKYKRMKDFEVAFWLEGTITHEDDYIGVVECQGTRYREDCSYSVRDGRLYFNVSARSIKEAYDIGKQMYMEADVGDMNISDYGLEHVYDGEEDKYYYLEDIPF